MRPRSVLLIALLLSALVPREARADATLFIGATTTPASRQARGFAVGVTLLVVGIEFEYSSTVEDAAERAPSLRTGMGNLLVQAPFGDVQPYATVGAGLYRERLAGAAETHAGINLGGGVKVALAGPLRLRLDYRLFTLRGSPRHRTPQRIYAGLNLAF